MMILWGLLTFFMATVNDFGGLITLRLFLGIVQSGLFSGVLVYLVYFYTKEEFATRIAYALGSSSIARAFCGIFSHLIARSGSLGIPGWKTYVFLEILITFNSIYLLQGSLCFAVGGLILLYLPNYPETAAFLTQADRTLAIARGRDGEAPRNVVDRKSTQTHPTLNAPSVIVDTYILKEALCDPRLWIFSISFFLVWSSLDTASFLAPQTSITSFEIKPEYQRHFNHTGMDDLVSDLKDASVHSVILSSVPYILGSVIAVPVSMHSDTVGERALHACIPLLVSACGFLFLTLVPPTYAGGGPARYFTGLLPAVGGILSGLPSLIAYAMDGTFGETHRSIFASVVPCLGLAFGSLPLLSGMFPISQEPGYWMGNLILSCFLIAACALILGIRWLNSAQESDVWGKPPGLRRLLNDQEEERAWEFELTSGIKMDRSEADHDEEGFLNVHLG